jgi:hypothetical protein
MQLTESQRVVMDWLNEQTQQAVVCQVKRIVENAVIQAAHGNTEPLTLLRKVAGYSGVIVTNYLESLRKELDAYAAD